MFELNEILYLNSMKCSKICFMIDASEEVVGNFSETARQRLDMVRVYTRPLVATKSEVNQNNFTSSKNNVTAGAKESSVSTSNFKIGR